LRRASRSIPSFLEFYSGRSGDNPLTDEQVKAFVGLLGPDDAHGVAWSLLHVIEAAPGRGIKECLQNVENEWVARLKRSVENAQLSASWKNANDLKEAGAPRGAAGTQTPTSCA